MLSDVLSHTMALPAPVLCILSLIPRFLTALTGASFLLSFLLPKSFQFVSPLTSAFESRLGTGISQPEISSGVVAEATLLDPYIPVQGRGCAPTSPA